MGGKKKTTYGYKSDIKSKNIIKLLITPFITKHKTISIDIQNNIFHNGYLHLLHSFLSQSGKGKLKWGLERTKLEQFPLFSAKINGSVIVLKLGLKCCCLLWWEKKKEVVVQSE